MADELKSVITELKGQFDEYTKANDERLEQIKKHGSAQAELEEKVHNLDQALNKSQDKLKDFETALARKSASASYGNPDEMEQKAKHFEALCAKRRGIPASGEFDAAKLAEYRKAFIGYMRKGDDTPEAMKALSVGSDPDGGYTVEPDTSGRIVTKIFESSPMRQVASVQTIGTDSLEGMYDLEEASAGWVGETEARSETGTPKLAVWRIPVHEMYAKPKATQKILDDSMIDIEAWLSGKVSDKFSRQENAAFVNGDGVGKPRGFLTYPTGSTIPGTIQRFKTGVNGGFDATGDGADVLISSIYEGLKQAYRSGARWFMPRSAVSAVRKLKAADGSYLWQPGISAGNPATLMGFPILEFEDMPTIATGSLSIAFGNMAEAYQIVDRQGIRVLRDPYSSKPYVEFYTTKRVGGDVLNFEALKLVEFSA